MREKKSMKKISDAPVMELQVKKNRARHHKEVASSLLDKDLFTVNAEKDGLQEKRAKLAKDRFEQKNKNGILKSKTEVAIMRKLAKKNPPIPVKKETELFDVWADTSAHHSNKIAKFKSFSKASTTRIMPVVVPLEG